MRYSLLIIRWRGRLTSVFVRYCVSTQSMITFDILPMVTPKYVAVATPSTRRQQQALNHLVAMTLRFGPEYISSTQRGPPTTAAIPCSWMHTPVCIDIPGTHSNRLFLRAFLLVKENRNAIVALAVELQCVFFSSAFHRRSISSEE